MTDTSRDSWRTPPEVVDWAKGVIGGGFDFDAACTHRNKVAEPLWNCGLDFTPGDSLSHRWPNHVSIWANVPYSRIDPWVDAALACKSLVAMLIMSPNGEERFARLIPRSHEIHIVGRIAFLDADGKPAKGNTRGSSLFLINAPFGLGQRSFVTRDEIYGSKAA